MRKLGLIALIMTVVLSMGAVSYAQGNDEFCGGLSEEDCDLYYDLQTGSIPLSTAFDLTMDAAVTAEDSTFDFGVQASGGYVYDLANIDAYLESLEDLSIIDISVGTIVDFLEEGMNSFDAELFLTVNPPAEAAMFLPMDTIELDLWFVDGVAYADLTPLSAMMEDPSLEGVYGIDAFELIRMALTEATVGDLLDAMETGGMEMDGGGDAFAQGFQQGFQQSFTPMAEPPEGFENVVTITRLENETVDGVELAVFETVVNIPALFEIEEIQQQVMANIPAEAGIDEEMLIGALVNGLEGSQFTTVERYGLDDSYLYSSESVIDFTIDPTAFEALDGEMEMTDEEMGDVMEGVGEATEEAGEMDAPMQPITFNMTITFERSEIDALEEIVLPEGAQVVPAETLMQLAAGGGM